MSFSSDIKDEILKADCRKSSCSLAFIAGISAFTMSLSGGTARFVTDGEEIAKRISFMLKRQLNIKDGTISLAGSGRGGKSRALCYDRAETEIILTALSENNSLDKKDFETDMSRLTDTESLRHYVMGAYVGGGFMLPPEKMYHLEFVSKRERALSELGYVLDKFGEIPKQVVRDKYHVMYVKSFDSIDNILNIAGAHKAMMELTNIKIEKEEKNTLNRKVNFEVANMWKTNRAAGDSINDIENIMYTVGLDAIPDQLREMALLRLANPEESLAKLALLSGLSRSGVNHRLKKLSEIAREL